MMDDLKKHLDTLLKERLPILAVDLLIDGTRWAKEFTDRSAKLLADGTVPAPGFLVDKARAYVKEQEEMYRILEPDEEWEARPFEPPPKKPIPKKKAAPKKAKAKKAKAKAKTKKPKVKAKAKAKKKRAPRKKKAPATPEKKEEPSS